MKTIMFISILLTAISPSFAQGDANLLQGTWQLIEGKQVTADTTYNYPVASEKRLKIIGKTHFITIWQDVNASYGGFNGGTYTFKDGLYVENLDYFSVVEWIGIKAIFKVKSEADKLTMIPATEDGQAEEYGVFEVWRRID